jgi:hypothetical protein
VNRTCSQCGETKPESEFYRDRQQRSRESRGSQGYRVECKMCTDRARLKGKTLEEVRAERREYMKRYRAGIRDKGNYGPR